MLLLIAGLLIQCSQRKELSNPTSFKKIITLYSSKYQSTKAPIIVQFNEDAVDDIAKKPKQNIITISPNVEGELVWETKNRLAFKPKEKLLQGENYQVSIQLDKIYSNIPDSLKEFVFEVETIEQNISFGSTYVTPINDSLIYLSGSLYSSDYMEINELKNLLSANFKNKNLKIKWSSPGVANRHHSFRIDSIIKKQDVQELNLALINKGEREIKNITIPAIGDFKLVDIQLNQEGNQQIKLLFSDIINQDQELKGILSLSEDNNEISIHDNYILIDFKSHITNPVDIQIDRNLLSLKKYKLQEAIEKTVEFEIIKPGVRLVETKTIYPYQTVLPLTIETVNLNAVDIKITKVYQNNILQFLQQNDLDGTYNLRYVGESVVEKKIALNTKENVNLWNKQTIDLKPLISKDPTALYHVELGFRRSYSTYPCSKMENENYDPSTIGINKNVKITEENFWDSHNAYESYDWDQRENPCHSMYYREDYYGNNKSIFTNILGSNLGMIAKKEKDGDVMVFVNAINTANPVGNAQVDIYNKQNQKLKTVYTNQQGVATITEVDKAFLAIASLGQQRGYLKLYDSESLSLSRFKVDGTSNRQNIKGFLYAERGVWRPGDSIYLNLIIEDKDHSLPANYPIGFEFINPDGQVIERRTTTQGLNGHYKFWTNTDVDDKTGNYYVNAYVGDNVYSKTIKIETIRPNRLKMNLSFGKQEVLFTDSAFTTEIKTKWLHGAPGKNLNHKVDVTLVNGYTNFKDYEDFSFRAPYREFNASDFVFLEKETDENGEIKTKMRFNGFKNAPGFLRANFTVKAFEKGGRFSIDETSKVVHPFKSYVGINRENDDPYYRFNKAINKEIVNLSYLGKPLDDELIVKLYKVDYDWWYDLSTKSQYNYKGELNKKTVFKDTLKTKNGKVTIPLILTKDFEEGKYLLLIQNSEGHVTGEEMYFYDYQYDYEEVEEVSTTGTKELTITSDKESYESGQWAELSIPTQNRGRVLVSIEDGQNIVSAQWINVTGKTTKYRFMVGHNMPSYIYANVIYVQPHNKNNDLPLRMYGVLPININAKNSKLNPVLKLPSEIKPKTNYTVQVKEQNNLPMTYTLAIVDEGLLDITHYRTPNIWQAFNHKPALEVKTWDFYDRIVDRENFYTKNLLSIGGDGGDYEENEVPEGIKLNRFKPVVKFIGPFYCAPGQTKTHQLEMENYVGAVRVMVVAGHNKAYGKTEKTVEVKNPLMVLGTMPRVLGPKEEISLPVDVFAMEKDIKNVKITIETNDLITIDDAKTKSLTFSKIENQQVYFKLKTKEKFGVANLKIKATSGIETAEYEVELQVRPSNDYQVIPHQLVLKPGTTFDQVYKSFGYKGTNSLSLEVSSIPAINLEKRLSYLIHYPYGCVEQTTSSVFPQLFLSELMDLDTEKKREIERNVRAGIKRLKQFQTREGGFGYWPGDYDSHEWASNYVGHFLLEAKARGFEVSDITLKNWIDYQTEKASEWSDSKNTLPQTYRLYLLAKADKPNVGAMNRMRLKIKENNLSLWYLAASYQLIGKNSVAQDLIKKAPISITYDQSDIYSFGSIDRDNAIVLHMMSELNLKEQAWKMTKQIAEKLNKDNYMSTQTTAYCLLAVSSYTQGYDAKQMTFQTSFPNDKTIKTDKCLWQQTEKFEGSKNLKVTNTTSMPLFITILEKGIPKDFVDTLNENKGIVMQVRYTNSEGKTINPTSLKQGDDLIAEIQVYNATGKYQNHISLTQVVPSGWEIINTDMFGSTGWRNEVNNEEIRDDRVNLFYNLYKGQTKTFKIQLNASYVGKYYLPAIQTEAMYNHEVRARKPGYWVSIEK